MKEKKETPHIGKTMVPPRWKPMELASANLPILIVLSFCLAFAVHLGVLQPELYYQKTSAEHLPVNLSVSEMGGSDYAYASGDFLLFKLPHAQETGARALFLGTGHATSIISYARTDQAITVTKIIVNDNLACAPCVIGKEYPVDASRDISVEVFAKETALVASSDDGTVKRAFFEKSVRTNIDALIYVKLTGGWRPLQNSAVPSSFYGEDAPFHINRVPVGASHLLNLQWPFSSSYTYLSAMPASLIYILNGASHQYAFKLWEILMFFLPVATFYLFSRKLSRGKDAVFLFASLIYLFLPSQGMLVGGGSDIFMYGMVARTFAALLSLISLLFAYEFIVERKNRGFWLSLLFFVLAVASQPKILMTLAIGFGVLFVLSLIVTGARRAILLGFACTAAVAFLVAPHASIMVDTGMGTGGGLGGVAPENIGWSLVGFFQLGYYALPLLFIAGAATAVSKREIFLLFLFATCALVFVITTREVNKLLPFLDGLRFMSSFFPLVFFISGAGALFVFENAIAWAEKAGSKIKLDRLDTTVSFCLAIIAPIGIIFSMVALTTMDQYRNVATPIVAAEYSELQTAYSIVGDECLFVQGRMDVSQYPIYEQGLDRSFITYMDSSGAIIDAMANMRCRYLLLGNVKIGASISENTRWQEYQGFKNESRLEEIAYGGSNRLFALKEVKPAAKVESDDARVDWYSFDYDRGNLHGECMMENCTIRIRRDRLPDTLACVRVVGCSVSYGTDNAIYVSGIPHGNFDIALEPQTTSWFYPLVLMGVMVALICGYVASKLGDSS